MSEEWLEYLRENAPDLHEQAVASIKHQARWRDDRIAQLEALLDDIASLYRTCDADWCGKSGPDSECFACKVGHILAKREQT
jgi:hypothetical protein